MPSKIKKRGSGSYLLSVAVGYDSHGRQVVKTKTVQVSSRREAEKAYSLFAAEVMQGKVTCTGRTKLADFAQMWFDEHVKKNLAPKTQHSYRNHLNKRILPALGHLDISKIRPQHIMKFLNMLDEGKVRFDDREGRISSESLMYCFRVLSSMMQDAVQWQVISDNPCARVKPPKVEQRKQQSFDEESIARMIEALGREPLKYRAITFLALDTGLCLGELMALKWVDIDFDRSLLSVSKSNQALRGRGIYTKEPKNKSSIRQVAISASVLDLLGRYREWQTRQRVAAGEMWADEDWLFTKHTGKPMYPTTPSHWFRAFLKRNGLPPMRFHSLRHLSATLLIALNVPLKNVSSRLGHADIRTTANIYGAALQSVDHQAADKMDGYLRQIGRKSNPDVIVDADRPQQS